MIHTIFPESRFNICLEKKIFRGLFVMQLVHRLAWPTPLPRVRHSFNCSMPTSQTLFSVSGEILVQPGREKQ